MPIETKASAENAEINSYKVKIYCGQVSAVPIAFNKSAAAEIDDCKIGKDWIVIKNEDKK